MRSIPKNTSIVVFTNPHPGGVMGCPRPLPEPIEDAINKLVAGGPVRFLTALKTIADSILAMGDTRSAAYSAYVRGGPLPMVLVLTRVNTNSSIDNWRLLDLRPFDPTE